MLECLIVCSIIALLAAILLPSLQAAQQTAVSQRCLNTLRLFSIANCGYSNDWNGWALPVHVGLDNADRKQWFKITEFRSYMNLSLTTDRIPADMVCSNATKALANPSSGGYAMNLTYGYNYTWTDPDACSYSSDFRGFRVSKVRSPSMKIQFADGLDWVITWSASDYYLVCGESPSWETGLIAYRHDYRANVSYWDGHVKTEPVSVISKVTGRWVLHK